MIKKVLLLNLLISFTISWNSNSCAWGAIGKEQPQNKTACLGDQTSMTSNCCYMKLKIMNQQIFQLCYSLPKYIINAGTDEELAKGLQNDIGSLFKIMELNCRSENPIEPDKRNIMSPNTCAYDTLKYNPPKEINDCVKDIDPANSSKCCYTESKWGEVTSKSCGVFSKIRDLDFATWKTVYKSMGGELTKMECNAEVKEVVPEPQTLLKNNGHYLLSSFNMVIMLYLFFIL